MTPDSKKTFIQRPALVTQCLDALQQHAIIALCGPDLCGKSDFIQKELPQDQHFKQEYKQSFLYLDLFLISAKDPQIIEEEAVRYAIHAHNKFKKDSVRIANEKIEKIQSRMENQDSILEYYVKGNKIKLIFLDHLEYLPNTSKIQNWLNNITEKLDCRFLFIEDLINGPRFFKDKDVIIYIDRISEKEIKNIYKTTQNIIKKIS